MHLKKNQVEMIDMRQIITKFKKSIDEFKNTLDISEKGIDELALGKSVLRNTMHLLKDFQLDLAGQLSWLECCPNAPRLWV